MKRTPSNCDQDECAYNVINPGENEQECIGCPYLKNENWMPKREKETKQVSETESKELKVYEVTNRETGEKRFACGYTPEEAVKSKGWQIEDCFVVLSIQHRKLGPKNEPVVLVRISCQVCPFQWAECAKPPAGKCPCQREMPDLNHWLAEVTKAHLCDFVGEELTRTDYRQGQKWIPIAQAIKELSPQH